jgi:flagellar basal body-associated protein FliL
MNALLFAVVVIAVVVVAWWVALYWVSQKSETTQPEPDTWPFPKSKP